MRHLYEYGLPADKKDTERIQGIMDKAKGDIAKATKLAQNMAKVIKDDSKMQRRYQAAVDLLGADHPVAKAFNPSGADTTPSPGKPATPKSPLEQVLDRNPQILSDIKAAFKFKGLNFDSFNKSKLMVLTPAEAFKYGGEEGDKYFKIWVADGRIGFVTWANTMIDTKFRWNSKGKGGDKRDQASIIGTKADIDGYYRSNNYIKKMETVFMMPFEAFGRAAIEMVDEERNKFRDNTNFINLKHNSVYTPIKYTQAFTESQKYLLTCDKLARAEFLRILKKAALALVPELNLQYIMVESIYGQISEYVDKLELRNPGSTDTYADYSSAVLSEVKPSSTHGTYYSKTTFGSAVYIRVHWDAKDGVYVRCLVGSSNSTTWGVKAFSSETASCDSGKWLKSHYKRTQKKLQDFIENAVKTSGICQEYRNAIEGFVKAKENYKIADGARKFIDKAAVYLQEYCKENGLGNPQIVESSYYPSGRPFFITTAINQNGICPAIITNISNGYRSATKAQKRKYLKELMKKLSVAFPNVSNAGWDDHIFFAREDFYDKGIE